MSSSSSMEFRTNEDDDATFPSVTVRWLVHNTSSNSELAALSNVCQRWRQVVAECIQEVDGSNTNKEQSIHSNNSSNHRFPFQSLLLPSMARQVQSQQSAGTENYLVNHQTTVDGSRESPNRSAAVYTSMAAVGDDDTFCVVWFHPGGMEYLLLSPDADTDGDDDDGENDTSVMGVVAPFYANDHRMEEGESSSYIPMSGGDLTYTTGSEDGRRNGYSRRRPKSPIPLSAVGVEGGRCRGGKSNLRSSSHMLQQREQHRKNLVSCMYQWNGYSEAIDVLRPFGYAPAFVRRILKQARFQPKEKTAEPSQQVNGARDTTIQTKPSLGTISSTSSLSGRDRSVLRTHPPFQTFAVRGATYARPEGYCLCWDHDMYNSYYFSERSQDSKAMVRQQEWNEIQSRRTRRRRELQREVLPVVLWSKRNEITPFNNEGSCNTPKENEESFCPKGILQPCIQFLNVTSSHAVRLFTPPFANGPISTPLTVFCVAIATEDGCFFSGLRNKFELGHLYPANTIESLIERSPICLCADYHGPVTRLFETVTSSDAPLSTHQQQSQHNKKRDVAPSSSMLGHRNYSSSGLFNSDDSSCDMSYFEATAGDVGLKCHCPFTGLGDVDSNNEFGSSQEGDKGNEDSGQVCRGRLGPGMWHCYVAVFDGKDSLIRIDGEEESVSCDTSIPPSFRACLDGLTIGADHTFDMSLCFGQGSDGEGEGAMAELAMFRGKLEQQDIKAIESHLMQKHGIPSPTCPHYEVVLEDEYMRLAQSLIAEPLVNTAKLNDDETPSEPRPVPLRYLTKLREVSWKQVNPVTGEAIAVQRIGSHTGNDSSEW